MVAAVAACYVSSAMIVGCDDFHTSGNGSLDGFWQLQKTDTLKNGRSGDMRQSRIFWAVQADLLQMQDLNSENHRHHVFFRFELKNGLLRLWDQVYDDRTISDSIVTDVRTVQFYGLSDLEETFKVLRLESSDMTLESEHLRLYFRKY